MRTKTHAPPRSLPSLCSLPSSPPGKSGYGASMATNTWPMVLPDATSPLERLLLNLIPSP